jgi:hypothetical protein
LESTLQHDIIEYLRGRGDVYWYNAGGSASSAKGTPDLLVCCNGRFVGLELKRSTGSYGATKPQLMRIAAIRRAGGVAEVVTSIEDVAALLLSL